MESQLSMLVNKDGDREILKIEKNNDGFYYELADDGSYSEKVDEKYYQIIESYEAFVAK